MKLSSEEAKGLLEDIRKDIVENDSWINHSICVGNAAGKIAEALNEQGYNVNVDKAITLGYIHDIGKYNGVYYTHAIEGYNYLKDHGYDDEYCNVCLTHSCLNNDIICTAGGVPDPKKNVFLSNFIENHEYTLEEKIVNLCDLMCPQGNEVVTVDKRLIDIMMRRGAYSNTQYHIKEAYKLKESFDDMLGYDVYNIFPEIKDNL